MNCKPEPLTLDMLTVSLHGAEFFAYHGFYPEEQMLGCRFVLNIDVTFEPAQNGGADEISNTVNYEQLYAIARQEMQQTKKLLEAVIDGIAGRIRADFPFVQHIKVELKKLNPPMGGTIAYSAVTLVDYRD